MTKLRSMRTAPFENGHTCAFEITRGSDGKGMEFYVVFDGQRVAYRGQPDTPEAGTWVSIRPGYQVEDIDNGDGIAVWVSGNRIN